MQDEVLVLYNGSAGSEDSRSEWSLSDAGVLEEVAAVTGSLGKLKIQYRAAAVTSLQDVTRELGEFSGSTVFNLVQEVAEGTAEGCYVPAICTAFGKACTGNTTEALLLTLDKVRTKAVLCAAGLSCPHGVVVATGNKVKEINLPSGRYIVKPVMADASEGIWADSIVNVPGDGLEKAVSRIHEMFGQAAIVEAFIPEREINVALLEVNSEPEVLAVAEIDFSAFEAGTAKIVDYAAKWEVDSFGYNNTPRKIPADISMKAMEEVKRLAIEAWHVTRCRGHVRVDFRLDENEKPYILEVNCNPDISPEAGYAAALEYAGVEYHEFVKILIDAKNKISSFDSK